MGSSQQNQQWTLEDAARFPDMNPGPVLRIDNTGEILLANKAAREIFGNDLVGKSWFGFCTPATGEKWDELLKPDMSVSVESKINGKDFVFLHRVDDTAELVFVYGSDVTDLKDAQTELAEVARFPDMNPGPVVRLNGEGTVLLSNRAAREVFGAELDGRCWLDVCPEVGQDEWDRVTRDDELVSVESKVGASTYQFTHRCDPVTRLVFVYGADVTEQRRLEEELRQTEKMAALGKLSAGLAHELNNPAAAAGRASDQIMEAVTQLQDATAALAVAGLDEDQWRRIEEWERSVRERHANGDAPSSLELSDREEALFSQMEELDFPAPWEAAPVLAGSGFTVEDVDRLETQIPPGLVNAVLVRTCRALTVSDLADVLAKSSRSISDLVGAVKSYSHMDRAPVQSADIHDGIEDTLTILRHKLKNGVTVIRDYDRSIPVMEINGSELNQVWTNLVDNAVDAMNERGTLTIRTQLSDGSVVVEIGDDGPGIPDEIKDRLFEPFFTTKDVGKGTGLGLDIVRRIATERSGGNVTFSSTPAGTVFRVELPIARREGPNAKTRDSDG